MCMPFFLSGDVHEPVKPVVPGGVCWLTTSLQAGKVRTAVKSEPALLFRPTVDRKRKH